MSIFEQASRNAIRFSSNKGELTTEELWSLSLDSLNSLAVGVHNQLKASEEISFINKKSSTNVTLELKMEILKRIIEVKLADKEAKANKAVKDAKLAELKALINEKQSEALKGQPIEAIQAMIAELEKD